MRHPLSRLQSHGNYSDRASSTRIGFVRDCEDVVVVHSTSRWKSNSPLLCGCRSRGIVDARCRCWCLVCRARSFVFVFVLTYYEVNQASPTTSPRIDVSTRTSTNQLQAQYHSPPRPGAGPGSILLVQTKLSTSVLLFIASTFCSLSSFILASIYTNNYVYAPST